MTEYLERLKNIENFKFALQLNIASNLSTFLNILQSDLNVKAILSSLDIADLNERKEKIGIILERIVILSNSLTDVRYESKWDVAIAVYVWLLSIKTFDLSAMISEVVIDTPRCWWARKICHNILIGRNVYSEQKNEEVYVNWGKELNFVQTHSSKDVIFYPAFIEKKVENLRNYISSEDKNYKNDSKSILSGWQLNANQGVLVNPLRKDSEVITL